MDHNAFVGPNAPRVTHRYSHLSDFVQISIEVRLLACMMPGVRPVLVVPFTRNVRRQVTNYGLVTAAFNWPVRCAQGERDLPPLFVFKSNLRFLISV